MEKCSIIFQKGTGANGDISLEQMVPQKWFTYQNLQNFTMESVTIFWLQSVRTAIFKTVLFRMERWKSFRTGTFFQHLSEGQVIFFCHFNP